MEARCPTRDEHGLFRMNETRRYGGYCYRREYESGRTPVKASLYTTLHEKTRDLDLYLQQFKELVHVQIIYY